MLKEDCRLKSTGSSQGRVASRFPIRFDRSRLQCFMPIWGDQILYCFGLLVWPQSAQFFWPNHLSSILSKISQQCEVNQMWNGCNRARSGQKFLIGAFWPFGLWPNHRHTTAATHQIFDNISTLHLLHFHQMFFPAATTCFIPPESLYISLPYWLMLY